MATIPRLVLVAVIAAIIVLCSATTWVTASHDDPVTDYRAYWTAPANSPKRQHIFFVGIPMPGHMFPLLATAEELAKRGYTVTVSSFTSINNVIKSHIHPLVNHFPIGECTPAVKDWRQLQIEMNGMVDFADSTTHIFQWVQDMHPCHYSSLHATMVRSELQLDFNPSQPDYNQLPPVDIIISDLVTQPMHDLARTLSIRFLLNNPDILQVLPGNTVGNWNNIPLMFHEDSLHPFNYGIEMRKYSQQFHPNNNPALPSTLAETNFTQILTDMDHLDPNHIGAAIQSGKSFQLQWSTFTTAFHYWYGFITRLVYSFVRPLIEIVFFYTNDYNGNQIRHIVGEIYLYHHLQHYIALLRAETIPQSLLVLRPRDEPAAVQQLLMEYNYDNVTLAQLCSSTTTTTPQLSIADYNTLLTKFFGPEFVIADPTKLCALYTRYQTDLSRDIAQFIAPPQNPTKLNDYYTALMTIFQLSPPDHTQQQQQQRQHQYPSQYKPLKYTFRFHTFNFPLAKYVFNYWDSFRPTADPEYTPPFEKNSIPQRYWSFYKNAATHWTSLFFSPGVPVIQCTIFGVEFQRPLPPFVHMVGPLIPDSNMSSNIQTKSTPAIERQLVWLDGTDDSDDDNNDDPIIYMSYGTLGHLDKDGTIALFQAYAQLINTTNLRVLWKLTTHYVEMVVEAYLSSGVYIEGFFDAVEAIPAGSRYLQQIQPKIAHFHTTTGNTKMIPRNRWLFTEWVYSQIGVLEHTNTKIFLSHCGINSAYEAISAKTYIFCIPLFGDQGEMATMVSDRDVGLSLLKQNVNKDTLVAGVKFAMAQSSLPRFETAMAKLKGHIDLAGGKSRAADLVQFYLNHGSDHTTTPMSYNRAFFKRDHVDIVNYRYTQPFLQGRVGFQESLAIPLGNWFQTNDYDLYIFWIVIWHLVLFTAWQMFKCCRRTLCCCNGKHQRPGQDSSTMNVFHQPQHQQHHHLPPQQPQQLPKKSSHRKND